MSEHDAYFGPPSIDVDEWRDEPVRHRYVHGSFDGTETRFSLYFPPPESFAGRIFQFLEGGTGGSEHAAPRSYGFEIAGEIGALLVESNQGHIGFSAGGDLADVQVEQSVMDWRASVETLHLARRLAHEFYGTSVRHSYLYGASGGAVRTVAAFEASPGAWDGAVASVINRAPQHLLNWSVHALAALALDGYVDAVVDATDVGGTGDPFAVLGTDIQRQALASLYRAGFCRGAESQLTPNPFITLALNLHRLVEPTFKDEFWAWVEAGTATPLLRPYGQTATVQRLVPSSEFAKLPEWEDINRLIAMGGLGAGPTGLVLDVELSNAQLCGAGLTITTGAAAGRRVLASGLVDGACVAVLAPGAFEGVEVGDELEIDNRELVAFAHYHRFAGNPDWPSTGEFVVDGRPIHPRRTALDGLPEPTGVFEGKLILIQHAADRECWPNAVDPLVQTIRSNFGDRVDDVLRVYWMTNAGHLPPLSLPGSTRLVPYFGVNAQAVTDVVAWVEKGVIPPPSTSYGIGPDQELLLPPVAMARQGIQPMVTVTANGDDCARVAAGETVDLAVIVEVPPGAGTVVVVAWDFDGSGTWPEIAEVTTAESTHRAQTTRSYSEPGTYFVTCRAASHRDGAGQSPVRRVETLGRARVIVT